MARSTVARVLLSSLPIYSPSLALSIVRICSSRTVDSVLRPLVIIATWVGRAAFVFQPVIAAPMVVGLCLLSVLFCKIQNRTNAALLTAEAYAEVGGIDFASFNLFHS